MSAHERMDRMYRHQRYFYDVTRKYYLLGRDRLIRELDVRAGESILEIGCGTARNLSILAESHPRANFFGVDASQEMLATASQTIAGKKLTNIKTACVLADRFSYRDTFELENEFDTIFFSYSISMIDTWKDAIDNALRNLKPSGRLLLVDFYDQRDLPKFAAKLLQIWLSKFHVRYPDELAEYLQGLESKGLGVLSMEPMFRSYAFLASFEKAN